MSRNYVRKRSERSSMETTISLEKRASGHYTADFRIEKKKTWRNFIPSVG
jgi:predicted aspartyl protease